MAASSLAAAEAGEERRKEETTWRSCNSSSSGAGVDAMTMRAPRGEKRRSSTSAEASTCAAGKLRLLRLLLPTAWRLAGRAPPLQQHERA